MTIEIRDLVREDEAQVRAFWEVGLAAVAERPYNNHLAWSAARTYLRTPSDDASHAHLVAWNGDTAVGVGSLAAPLLENTDRAWPHVAVRPEARRRGLGSRLLGELDALAHDLGRALSCAEVYAPIDGASPGLGFAEHHGFSVVLSDEVKAVDLPETAERWDGLAAEVAPRHTAYTLETWWSPVPEKRLDGYCRLNEAFNSEAPSNDADLEDEVWSHERVRAREARAARAGRHDLVTVALDAAGEVVAMTELLINETVPHRAFQGGTLVLPAHRGHGLGLALKVANHRELLARWPTVRWMVTSTADVNASMNRINERLGYRPVERMLEMQRRIAP